MGLNKNLVLLISSALSTSAFTDVPHTFVAGETAKAEEVNENFTDLSNAIDDNTSTISNLTDSVDTMPPVLSLAPEPRPDGIFTYSLTASDNLGLSEIDGGNSLIEVTSSAEGFSFDKTIRFIDGITDFEGTIFVAPSMVDTKTFILLGRDSSGNQTSASQTLSPISPYLKSGWYELESPLSITSHVQYKKSGTSATTIGSGEGPNPGQGDSKKREFACLSDVNSAATKTYTHVKLTARYVPVNSHDYAEISYKSSSATFNMDDKTTYMKGWADMPTIPENSNYPTNNFSASETYDDLPSSMLHLKAELHESTSPNNNQSPITVEMNMPFQSLDEYITTHNALNFERYIPATSGGNHDWSDIFIWTGAGAIKPIGDSLIKFSWETVCSDSKGNFNEVIQQITGEAMFLKSF